jgi:hypothetical protein
MFYYILIICSGYSGAQSCLPPVYFNAVNACTRTGNAYKYTGNGIRARCVQVRRKDVR